MADENDTPRPFDVKTVEYLLRLMSDHDLSEVDLKEGDQRIRLRKGSAFPMPFPAAYPPAYPGPQAAPNAAHTGGLTSPNSPAAGAPSPPPATKYLEIKSEMVGTFYSRPKPDKPEFVTVGARVTPDTTICLIEAMKLYNDIKAGVSGTVKDVCVKNGDFVEFGTVLFRVDPG